MYAPSQWGAKLHCNVNVTSSLIGWENTSNDPCADFVWIIAVYNSVYKAQYYGYRYTGRLLLVNEAMAYFIPHILFFCKKALWIDILHWYHLKCNPE